MIAYEYRRVSKAEKDTGSVSLDWQHETIAAAASVRRDKIAAAFEDDGVSAGKLLATRKAGAQLMASTTNGKCRVYVAKLDRLFRSGLDFFTTVAAWDKAGVELVSVSEGFDMGSLFGRAMAGFVAVFAELERGLISERVRAGVQVRRDRNQRISGNAPWGFRFQHSGMLNPTGKPIQVLENDPREQAATTRMLLLAEKGYSYRRIAETLATEGVRGRRGEKLSHTTIRKYVAQARKRDTAGGAGDRAVTSPIGVDDVTWPTDGDAQP